jgi:phage-related protein
VSVELAVAHVQIIPSTRGIAGQMRKELGGPLERVSADAGRNAGKGFAANMASNAYTSLDSLGSRITSGLGTAFKIGGGVAAGLFAGSLVAGFSRLRAIDDARFKLQGLGHDTKTVDAIMKSAMDSVKGTAFGLGDAATIAASAVAAGVKPGKELTRTLSLTGDAAAIAGVGLGEMGQIFGKVAAGNRMMTQEMNQLTDRGIPILQWLAAEFKVTELAAKEMVSEGAVDFATFQKVIEDNIGGAALTMGGSFSGALENTKAAFGRLGAAMLDPIFSRMPAVFAGIITGVDKLGEVVGPLAAAFGEKLADNIGGFINGLRGLKGEMDPVAGASITAANSFNEFGLKVRSAVEGLVAAFQQASEWYDRNRDSIMQIAAAVGPAVVAIGSLATTVHVLRVAFRMLGLSLPVLLLMGFVAAVTYAWQNSETFRNVVTGAFNAIKNAVGPAIDFVTGLVQGLADKFSGGGGVSGAMEKFGGAAERVGEVLRNAFSVVEEYVLGVIDMLKPRFDSIGESFSTIGETVGPIIQWIGERLPGAFQKLWDIASPIINFLVTLIGDTLRMAFDGIVQAFQGAVQIISGIFEMFAGLFTGDWSRMWEGIKSIFSGVVNAVIGIVKTWLAVSVLKMFRLGFSLIRGLVTKGWTAIRGLFTKAGQGIVRTVRGWTDTIRLRIWQVKDAIRDKIAAVWNAIRTRLSSVMTSIRTAISNAWTTIRSGISNTVNAIRTRISTVFNAIRTVITTVVNVIRTRVTQSFNNIRTAMGNAATRARELVSNAFNRMRDAVRNTIDRLLGIVRGIPGRIIRGLGNVGRMLWDAGKKIIEGLIGGITAMGDKVKDAVSGVLSKARNLLPFSPAKEGPFAGRGWTLYAGRSLIDGLAQGIRRQEKPLVRAVSGVMASAQDAMRPDRLLPAVDVQSAFHADRGGFDITAKSAREELDQLRRIARAQEDTIAMLTLQTRRLEQATRQLVAG